MKFLLLLSACLFSVTAFSLFHRKTHAPTTELPITTTTSSEPTPTEIILETTTDDSHETSGEIETTSEDTPLDDVPEGSGLSDEEEFDEKEIDDDSEVQIVLQDGANLEGFALLDSLLPIFH